MKNTLMAAFVLALTGFPILAQPAFAMGSSAEEQSCSCEKGEKCDCMKECTCKNCKCSSCQGK